MASAFGGLFTGIPGLQHSSVVSTPSMADQRDSITVQNRDEDALDDSYVPTEDGGGEESSMDTGVLGEDDSMNTGMQEEIDDEDDFYENEDPEDEPREAARRHSKAYAEVCQATSYDRTPLTLLDDSRSSPSSPQPRTILDTRRLPNSKTPKTRSSCQ